MPLEAGRLRHRITIQRPVRTQDSVTGEITQTWSDAYTSVAAAVEPLSVREFMQSQADQSELSAKIIIRAGKTIDADMRILFRGQVYNIAGVFADKESGLEYLTLPVTQGVNEG